MFSTHKHSYLQSRSSGIPPRIINRAVNAANSKIAIDEYDHDTPYNRITSEQPCIPLENVDVTKRPQAFGRLALPKLRKELDSPDDEVVSQALNSIADMVHDPEHGYVAIALKIPDRMVRLLSDEEAAIRERVCMVYQTIAGLGDGKDAITKNPDILEGLSNLLTDDEEAVRMKAATCLEMISRAWMNADDLVDFGFVKKILEILPEELDEIKVVLMETLVNLMYCHGKEEAMENNAFELFTELMDSENDKVVEKACDCMMLLSSMKKGKKEVFKSGAIFKLTRLILHPNPEVYASAASALVFSSISTKAKIKLSKIQHIPDRLVDLCRDWSNPNAQIFGMKALTNICEHSAIRKYVYDKYINELNAAYAPTENIKRTKDTLVDIVTRIPSLY